MTQAALEAAQKPHSKVQVKPSGARDPHANNKTRSRSKELPMSEASATSQTAQVVPARGNLGLVSISQSSTGKFS